MTTHTPEELLKSCLRGERTAQEAFYRHFANRMMGVCMRYTCSREQAQDLLQDAFIKVFERLPQYRQQGWVEGWVHRIVVTTAIDHYRSALRGKHHTDLEVATEIGADQCDALEQLSVQETLALIKRLPDGYRLVLNLYAIEGYSHKEISEMLGIEERTSGSQLFKARKMLLRLMQAQEKELEYETKPRKSV